MHFKNDWVSLIVGRKFTLFVLFYCVFEGNFQVQGPRGPYILRGNLTEGFCITSLGGLYLEGLIHGGAYFQNFMVYLFLFLLSIVFVITVEPGLSVLVGTRRNSPNNQGSR